MRRIGPLERPLAVKRMDFKACACPKQCLQPSCLTVRAVQYEYFQPGRTDEDRLSEQSVCIERFSFRNRDGRLIQAWHPCKPVHQDLMTARTDQTQTTASRPRQPNLGQRLHHENHCTRAGQHDPVAGCYSFPQSLGREAARHSDFGRWPMEHFMALRTQGVQPTLGAQPGQGEDDCLPHVGGWTELRRAVGLHAIRAPRLSGRRHPRNRSGRARRLEPSGWAH